VTAARPEPHPPEGPPQPGVAARWTGAGFLGGAATVGLVWVIATRPAAPPAATPPASSPVTLQPIAAPPSPTPPEPAEVRAPPEVITAGLPASDDADHAAQPDAQPEPARIVQPAPPTVSRSIDELATRIRINEATAAELDLLPGIGPALAARIIEHRRTKGAFGEPKDLEKVRGIGPRTAERVTPYIRFD